jgi:hypothetical protein
VHACKRIADRLKLRTSDFAGRDSPRLFFVHDDEIVTTGSDFDLHNVTVLARGHDLWRPYAVLVQEAVEINFILQAPPLVVALSEKLDVCGALIRLHRPHSASDAVGGSRAELVSFRL